MRTWIRCGWLTALLLLAAPATATLQEVEAARQRAVTAEAPELASGDFRRAERALAQAREDAVRNRPERSLERAAMAITLYETARIAALDVRLLRDARLELDAARKQGAHRRAPRTLSQAEALAQAAANQIAIDNEITPEAERLALGAAATARRAADIARLASSKPDIETLVLEHEAQMAYLSQAAGLEVPPGQAPDKSVAMLASGIETLRRDEANLARELAESRAFMTALEEEIRILDQRLGGAQAERRQLVQELERQAREREQLELVSGLFSPAQARVLQQDGAIIIRLTGLDFPSGSASLPASSGPLLQRLERAILLYPDSRLVVEGHTDSQGGDQLNLRLSQDRAQAVVNHIVSAMRIPPQRVSAVGYGAERPIANNETAAGRAQNRRIDLLIIP